MFFGARFPIVVPSISLIRPKSSHREQRFMSHRRTVLIAALALVLPVVAAAQLSVQVSPDNGSHPDPKIRLAASSGNTVTFTVTNNGTIDAQFARTCTGLGNVTTVSCTALGLIAAGDSRVITATFSVAGMGTGSVQLSVTSTNPTGASGIGKWDVTIVAGAATVSPDGQNVVQTPTVTGAAQAFTVANTARAAGQYALSASCTGAVTACSVSPGAITLDSAGAAGASGTATVSYTAGAPGTQGGITVLATYSGVTLDQGSVNVQMPSLQVAPDGGAPVVVNANAALARTFTLTNTGPATVAYTLTPVCSGPGVAAGCTVTPTSGTVANNGVPVNATINYSSLAGGTSGKLVLRGSYGGVVLDTGYVDISVAVPPPTGQVTPLGLSDGATVIDPPGSARSQVFNVTNTGSPTTFTLTPACTGTGVVSGCSVNPATLALASNQTLTATVSYNTLASGASGKVALRAAVGAAVVDTGYTVLALAGASVVPLNLTDGGTVTLGPGQIVNQAFTVTNTGTVSTTVTITAACSGPGVLSSPCTPSPASVAVPTGPPTTVNVQFQTLSVGSAGKVVARATYGGVVLDTGYVNVSVTAQPSAPAVAASSWNPRGTVPRDQCLAIALGAAVAAECGDLRIVHPLPPLRTMNTTRSPSLLYNSQFAEPAPSVTAAVSIYSGMVLPDTIIGTLKRGTTVVGRAAWPGNQWTVGGAARLIRVRDTTASPATGLTTYTLDVTNKYNGTGPFTTSTPIEVTVVNRQSSPFGKGWWLAGLELLVPIAGTSNYLWVGGDGSSRVFTKVSASLWRGRTPFVDFADSLTIATNGSTREFTRRLPGGVAVVFDSASGRHLRTVNRLGHTTTFGYDGSGRLLTLSLPVPAGGPSRAYTFGYPPNQLTVTDGLSPARTTTVTLASGRVTLITDPDTYSVGFQYQGSTGLIIRRTDRELGVRLFTLDSLRKVVRSAISPTNTVGDSSIIQIVPAESRALGGTPSRDSASVFTSLDGPRTVADTTAFWLNTYSAPARIVNAEGRQTLLVRGGPFSGLVTSLTTVTGQTLQAAYDVRGRLETVVDLGVSPSRTTRYGWENGFDQLTKIVPPMGDSTTFGINPSNGNRNSETDSRSPAQTTTYGYATSGLLTSVTAPGVPAHRYHYDAVGNMDSSVTPLGARSYFSNNARGWPTTTQTQINVSPATFMPTVFTYNDWGQETTRLTGPSAGDHTTVTTGYDKEGRVTSVSRTFAPNPKGIGTLTDSWTFDKAGRMTSRTKAGGGTEMLGVDPAGNVTTVTTARGHLIVMTYDVMNRLWQRSIPEAIGTTRPGNSITPNTLTTAAYADTIAAELQTFGYTYDGRLMTATGCDGAVARTFDPNGELRSETLSIRNATGAACGTYGHTYTTSYTYDGNGRRSTMTVPSVFGGGQVTYSYATGAGGGRLTGLQDAVGNAFALTYKPSGELTRISGPGALQRDMAWDSDGRMTSDQYNNPCGPDWPCYPFLHKLRNTSFTSYDARGLLLASSDPSLFQQSSTASYSILGHVTRSEMVQQWLGASGDTVRYRAVDSLVHDGLANLVGGSQLWEVWIA
ncbi:MAG: hypothetical protein SF066_02250, partial [Thermoanaerobaculia bacterium]|nr:hypothetical protein [Thermoanaerobaculia bacterium]